MIQTGDIEPSTCVLFIPTLTAGGAERVCSVLANEWCDYPDVSVTVITLFDAPLFYTLDPRVTHVCLGLATNKGLLRRLRDLSWALFALRRAVLRLKPTFVLSFMNKYNVFCLVALIGSRQRVIAAERDSPTERLSWIRRALRRATYPLAAAVLVQSDAASKMFRSKAHLRHVAVLLNPVTQIVEPRERHPQKIILNVSRFHPKKGHSDLLRAFAGTSDKNWVLVLCGDGPLRSELERLAFDLGIAGRTRFLGTVGDLRPHLRSAGVFAFPSYWEGFPNALAEAMLAGIPCVSYDCPTGPSSLIDDGVNGLLVPVGDVGRLRGALEQLMTAPMLAAEMGARAATIVNRVEKQAVSRRYWETCQRAASTKLA
jgi:GalNAc-alpha-(1->4)-GalNAc-alpha-(1->3)-diNAcBac-PP-undecaprenol alpha-1,4-N-acetyl-D-galactosaminyltransferase